MTKQEILDTYYVLIESQEEFDKVLEIFDEWKGIFNSKTYKHYKSNTYLFLIHDYLLVGNYENSDNKKNFITFDRLLDLLDSKVDLLDVPILVQTREEWENVIYYFEKNNVPVNFSVGDFEPNHVLVYDSETFALEYYYEVGESYYKEEITYNDFLITIGENVEEELTKNKLKDIVIKHLIRNNDVNNSYDDLLNFVNEIDKRFNLRLI